MTALGPALALDYVRELSADVRAGIVLGAAGEPLAGDPALAEPARTLLAAARPAPVRPLVPRILIVVETVEGGVVCAAGEAAHAIVVVCGRFALPEVVCSDLRAVLAALAGAPAPPAAAPLTGGDARARIAAAERLISALDASQSTL